MWLFSGRLSRGLHTTRVRLRIVTTGLAIAVYGMQATLLGTLLPDLSRSLTPAQSGTLASVQSIALLIASLATGPVLDRVGAQRGIMSGLAMIALALLFLPSANGYLPLTAVMGLLGMGGGVISTSTNTMAAELGGIHSAAMLNRLNVLFGVGGLATPALGSVIGTVVLCRVIVLIAAGTFAMLALVPVAQEPVTRPLRDASDIRLLFRPLFALLCLFVLLYVAAEVGVWNWLAEYLIATGIPRDQALRVLSFGFGTGIIAGRLTAPHLLKRMPALTLMLVCSLFMAASTSALLFAHSARTAALAVICAGFSMAPVYPTTLAMVSEVFPRGTATAIGIAVTMGWVGVALSSKVIGSIAGDHPNRLGTALILLPVLSVMMCGVNLAIRRLQRASPEASC